MLTRTFALEIEMKHRILVCTISLLCCVAPVLTAQPDDKNTMPYAHMATVVEKYSATLAPHVTLAPMLTANTSETGERPELYLVIHAKRGDLRIPVASDGTFEFPVKKDLMLENPSVSLHGASGGGSFSIVAQFRKEPSAKREEIPYSEIMLPYTHGVKMQKQAKLRNPAVPDPKLLHAQILVATGSADPLVIKSSDEDIVVRPSPEGEFRVPYDASLVSENPMVLFPTNAVSMGRFVFPKSSKEQSKEKTDESEQTDGEATSKTAPSAASEASHP